MDNYILTCYNICNTTKVFAFLKESAGLVVFFCANGVLTVFKINAGQEFRIRMVDEK